MVPGAKIRIRNKLAVSAAVVVALALAPGAGISLWQAHIAVEERRRADSEAATARAINDFLRRDLLSQASSATQAGPGTHPDPDIKVRTALDRAAASLTGSSLPSPLWKLRSGRPSATRIRKWVSRRNRKIRLFGRSNYGGESWEPEHTDTLSSAESLAEVYQREGKYDAAERLLNNLLEIDRRLGRENSKEAIAALHTLAFVADSRADYPRAEVIYRRVLEKERRVLSGEDDYTLSTMHNLAMVSPRGQIRGGGRTPPEGYRDQAARTGSGASQHLDQPERPWPGVSDGREVAPEAEPRLQAVLQARRHALGEENPDTLGSMTDLGLLYLYEGKYTDAEPLLTQAVETSTKTLGEDNPETQRCLGNLARLYLRAGKLRPSGVALERLLKARERTYGPDSPFTVSTQALLGEVRLRQGAYSEADHLLRVAVDYYRRRGMGAATIWRKYCAEWLLGESLTGPGRNAEGEALLASAGPKLLQLRESIPADYLPILDDVRRWTERTALPRQ